MLLSQLVKARRRPLRSPVSDARLDCGRQARRIASSSGPPNDIPCLSRKFATSASSLCCGLGNRRRSECQRCPASQRGTRTRRQPPKASAPRSVERRQHGDDTGTILGARRQRPSRQRRVGLSQILQDQILIAHGRIAMGIGAARHEPSRSSRPPRCGRARPHTGRPIQWDIRRSGFATFFRMTEAGASGVTPS